MICAIVLEGWLYRIFVLRNEGIIVQREDIVSLISGYLLSGERRLKIKPIDVRPHRRMSPSRTLRQGRFMLAGSTSSRAPYGLTGTATSNTVARRGENG